MTRPVFDLRSFQSSCRSRADAVITHVSTLTCLVVLCGCNADLHDQPRFDTLEASDVFLDGQSARPLVEGTIPFRGKWQEQTEFETGKSEGQFVAEIPLEKIDLALLERGQERFNIYCSMCHGYTGDGNGMIVQRGFRRPPSLHIERLRNAPAGHFFDVMTNGFGAMPSYRVQVAPRDRWAIVAYVRVLQLSQNASADELSPGDLDQLREQQLLEQQRPEGEP